MPKYQFFDETPYYHNFKYYLLTYMSYVTTEKENLDFHKRRKRQTNLDIDLDIDIKYIRTRPTRSNNTLVKRNSKLTLKI